VYWRRRAVVLGAVLLAVIVLFVACTGGDDDKKRGQSAASTSPTATAASSSAAPDETTSFSDDDPGGGPSRPAPDVLESPQPNGSAGAQPGPGGVQPTGVLPTGALPTGAGTGQNANVTAPADGSCGDGEVAVTPIPASTTVRRGTKLEIKLKIKNVSARSCNRDLGAQAQELYIEQGARKAWSSDTCSGDSQSGVVSMAAGAEYEYKVTWNGLQATKCSGGLAAGPAPAAGQYELRGRLGTKVSAPVLLSITS
jgi:hypothetical protein